MRMLSFPICCFKICAALMLAFSAVFHLLYPYDQRTKSILNKMDYVGIVIMVVGSTMPVVRVLFICQPVFQLMYMSLTTTAGVGVTVFLMDESKQVRFPPLPLVGLSPSSIDICLLVSLPFFHFFHARLLQGDEYTQIRGGLFVAFGLMGLFPCLHHVALVGWDQPHTNMVVMGALYITGAIFYGSGFPNFYFPGKFDLVGGNHQIFHLFVVAAAVYHWVSWSHHLTTLTENPCWS
jgi:adiponectin receptor